MSKSVALETLVDLVAGNDLLAMKFKAEFVIFSCLKSMHCLYLVRHIDQ